MTNLEVRNYATDALVIDPPLAISHLSYLLSTMIYARKLSNMRGDEILNTHATSMRKAFSEPGVPVIVKAKDEEDDLPKLLFALSRSDIKVNPIIIDNASVDSTPAISRALGLTVVEEKTAGVVPGSIAAFNYIREAKLDKGSVLFSDADGIPGIKWASSMIKLLENLSRSGGIGYGLYAYFGGQLLSDTLLTPAYHMKSLVAFKLRSKVTAHGGNSGIRFDDGGKILNECINLDPQFTIGLGGLIRDRVKSAKGVAVRSFSPYTLSPTRSDRMPDIMSVVKLFISHRKAITKQYSTWFLDHPGSNYNEYMEQRRNSSTGVNTK